MMKPMFFATPSELRAWLHKYHATKGELWVGYHKKATGKPSITWPETVDEALCYGWIDGIRKSIDDSSYKIRLSPRKPGSIWSGVNTKRAKVLIDEGRMQPAGLKAFEARKEYRSGIYSYEQRSVDLPDPYYRLLKKNKAAWNFFQEQPPSYRKAIYWWIVCAKKEETRLKRLELLIALSFQKKRLPMLTSAQKAPKKAKS
jgi:uncharacterized protein YdeI (YjbR/CyaY-like superfamily)